MDRRGIIVQCPNCNHPFVVYLAGDECPKCHTPHDVALDDERRFNKTRKHKSE